MADDTMEQVVEVEEQVTGADTASLHAVGVPEEATAGNDAKETEHHIEEPPSQKGQTEEDIANDAATKAIGDALKEQQLREPPPPPPEEDEYDEKPSVKPQPIVVEQTPGDLLGTTDVLPDTARRSFYLLKPASSTEKKSDTGIPVQGFVEGRRKSTLTRTSGVGSLRISIASRVESGGTVVSSQDQGVSFGEGVRKRKEKHKKGKERPMHAGLNQRANYKMIVDGHDVTPKTLYDNSYQAFEEQQLIALDMVTGIQSMVVGFGHSIIGGTTGSAGGQRMSGAFTDISVIPLSFNTTAINLDEMATIENEISTYIAQEEAVFERVPSAFCFPAIIEPVTYPSKANIVLKETETIFLLEMLSVTAEKYSEEAKKVEAANEKYEFITVGKGKNRKVANEEVQTVSIFSKEATTMASRPRRRNGEAYSSEWDMLDTYNAIEEAKGIVIEHDPLDSLSPFYIHHRKLDRVGSVNLFEKELVEANAIMSSAKFKAALLVIERLLASNVFKERQKRFRGLAQQDLFRLDLEYLYRLDELWEFKNANTENRSVSSMCWNFCNHDILAVGYGKFNFIDQKSGMVAIWNIKNPTQPEREYEFKTPVTAIDFSKKNPNLLAIGFYNGGLSVIDISEVGLHIVGESNRFESYTFEPIWQIKWYFGDDFYADYEQIMCIGQDGKISRYQRTKTTEMVFATLMRVTRMEGAVQGVYNFRRCIRPEINISRYPAALVLCLHPTQNDIYFVGTDEGCVHKCSINYPNQHLELILAHTGPVFAIEFSPFVEKMYITCGGDWYFRIWMEGIGCPILQMRTSLEPVQGICWSPTNSCIIACICGNTIQMWDLSRKMFSPCSETTVNSRITLVHFTASGTNLVISTIDGTVNTYTLEDMPFPPYFQSNLILSCIKKALVAHPELLKKMKKQNLIT